MEMRCAKCRLARGSETVRFLFRGHFPSSSPLQRAKPRYRVVGDCGRGLACTKTGIRGLAFTRELSCRWDPSQIPPRNRPSRLGECWDVSDKDPARCRTLALQNWPDSSQVAKLARFLSPYKSAHFPAQMIPSELIQQGLQVSSGVGRLGGFDGLTSLQYPFSYHVVAW